MGTISLVHRYYDPVTSQFLSVDPLVDATGTPYAFTVGDPVNGSDPSGLGSWYNPCSWGNACHHLNNAAKQTVNRGRRILKGASSVGEFAAYVPYYACYDASKEINQVGGKFGLPGSIISHTLVAASPLASVQVEGLAADASIDAFETYVLRWPTEHGVDDEGVPGHELPGGRGPVTYLPGIHSNGQVDLQW